jgi:hypothetical protein
VRRWDGLAPFLVLVGLVLPTAVFAALYAVPTTTWAVMTDELQVVRLAVSISETFSPIPTIHGVYYGAHSQLYPLLLAPLYGMLPAPAASTAAHALNTLLLAGTAVPAYLLARSVTGSRGAGYVAAALTVLTPWLALSATLLTENAAYPAFAWAVLLCHRTIARPSPRRDALALAGLMLAYLARTQLLVLVAALPVALALHELGYAFGTRTSARATTRRTLSEHRVLAGAYAGAVALAGALALGGALGGVVGNYTVPFRGQLVPDGLWSSAAAHLDQIAVGMGLLPVALAASWACTTALRPSGKEGHAFAALLAVLVPGLTLQVTSFDLRFTPGQFIQERYLMYAVPLVAVGASAWLAQRTQLRLRLVTLAVAAAGLVGLLGLAAYDEDVLIYWASPAAAFYPEITAVADGIGLSGIVLLQLATLVVTALVAVAAWRTPRLAMAGTAVVVSAFGLLQAGYVLERFVEPYGDRAETGAPRDWVDRAVAGSASVALVPGGPEGATAWWEAELWNKDVDRVLRVGSGPTFSPFPSEPLSVDLERGLLVGARPSDYLVLSRRETRFALDADSVAAARGLVLFHAPGAYRLEWATRGVLPDGWTRPRTLALLRLYAHEETAARRTVTLTLAASRFAPRPVDFVLRGGGQVVYGEVHPGGARPPVDLTLCVPARGSSDVWLTTNGRTRLLDGRAVAVHIERLQVSSGGPCSEAF